jgi:hypothetical protein
MMKNPNIAKPARQPAIPPTTAAVLTEPEELAVEEGVADVMVPVLMTIFVGDEDVKVECVVTATTGVVDGTVCGTKVEEVDEVVVLETVAMLEDVVDEGVVEEEEVVGGMEGEDCVVEVATGVAEVGVAGMTGAEELVGVSDFCAAEVCALVAAEVKIESIKVGLKRAAKRMWLRLSKS